MNITNHNDTGYSQGNHLIQTAHSDHIIVLAHGVAKYCEQNDALPKMNIHNELDNLKCIIEIGHRYLTANHNQIDDTFSTICHHSFYFADKLPEGNVRQEAQKICQERFSIALPTGLDKLPIELVQKCLSYLEPSSPKPYGFFSNETSKECLISYAYFRGTSKRYQDIYEDFIPSLINKGETFFVPGIDTFETLEPFLIKYGSRIQKLNLSKWDLLPEDINALIKHCPHLIELSIPVPKTDIPQSESTVTLSNFKHILQHENVEILQFYPNDFQMDCNHFFDHCITGLPKLKTLYFKNVGITDLYYSQPMAHIEKIVSHDSSLKNFSSLISNPQLKHLDLFETNIKDITELSSFKLQSLNLKDTPVGDYTSLQEQFDLKRFYFGTCDWSIDIAPIQHLKQLKVLGLPVIADDLSPLKNLCQLEELDGFYLDQNSNSSNLSIFKNLINLKHLNISISIPIDNLFFLSQLVEMENFSLNIFDLPNSDSQQRLDVSVLSNFKKLKRLELTSSSKILDFDEREVLLAINGLVHLEYLCLHNTIYSTKESIEELRNTLGVSSQEENEVDGRKKPNKRLFSEHQDQNEDQDQEPLLKKMYLENTP